MMRHVYAMFSFPLLNYGPTLMISHITAVANGYFHDQKEICAEYKVSI
jgi:hypothetical protein